MTGSIQRHIKEAREKQNRDSIIQAYNKKTSTDSGNATNTRQNQRTNAAPGVEATAKGAPKGGSPQQKSGTKGGGKGTPTTSSPQGKGGKGSEKGKTKSKSSDRASSNDPRKDMPCFIKATKGFCDRENCLYKHNLTAAEIETAKKEAEKRAASRSPTPAPTDGVCRGWAKNGYCVRYQRGECAFKHPAHMAAPAPASGSSGGASPSSKKNKKGKGSSDRGSSPSATSLGTSVSQ